MNKIALERFIAKYNLAGSCEGATYVSNGSDVYTTSISDDKGVLAQVTAKGVGLCEGEFPIHNTQKLKSLLGVVGESVSTNVATSKDRNISIDFFDQTTLVTYVLADKNVISINKVPDVKPNIKFDVEFELSEQFTNTFIRAKSALPDAETFTITSDGKTKKLNVILGYSSNNTNRVKMSVEIDTPIKIDPIHFSAKYFREILVNNKDSNGKLKLKTDGLAKVEFTSTDPLLDITSVYYLFEVNT